MPAGPRGDELYGAYYFRHDCGKPYERTSEWLQFFDQIAAGIVRDINPTSVLDAGCALGFLVEGLRSRGVEAFGIDVSSYAIDRVHESVKAYCSRRSLVEPLERRYDLIVCIEVLEHVDRADIDRVVENLCGHTDDIIFSSTPFDYREDTHVSVRPPESWAELFFRHDFVHDVEYDASFVTPWAVRFRRRRDPIQRVIVPYERQLWARTQENQALRSRAVEVRDILAAQERRVEELEGAVQEAQTRQRDAEARLADADRTLAAIRSSRAWSVLGRLWYIRRRVVPPGSRRAAILGRLLPR